MQWAICIAEFKQKPKVAVHRNEAPIINAVSDFVIFGGHKTLNCFNDYKKMDTFKVRKNILQLTW